jgi:ribosomal protein L4
VCRVQVTVVNVVDMIAMVDLLVTTSLTVRVRVPGAHHMRLRRR